MALCALCLRWQDCQPILIFSSPNKRATADNVQVCKSQSTETWGRVCLGIGGHFEYFDRISKPGCSGMISAGLRDVTALMEGTDKNSDPMCPQESVQQEL